MDLLNKYFKIPLLWFNLFYATLYSFCDIYSRGQSENYWIDILVVFTIIYYLKKDNTDSDLAIKFLGLCLLSILAITFIIAIFFRSLGTILPVNDLFVFTVLNYATLIFISFLYKYIIDYKHFE